MKGICFIEPLFHKVVKGEKTQTRRMIIPQPDFFDNGLPYCETDFRIKSKSHINEDGEHFFEVKPKYKIGEIVYLKEPYIDDLIMERTIFKYDRSDVQELISRGHWKMLEQKGFWKNKLFMPAAAARYFIKITAVRAERLQDISNEDCLKEGIEFNPEATPIGYPFGVKFPYNNGYHNYTNPKEAYAFLIDRINRKGTWNSNPFVWVYDFELINPSQIVNTNKK